MGRYNASRRSKTAFAVGDLVWVLRPQPKVSSYKLLSWWVGPARVVDTPGANSYVVQYELNSRWTVHRDVLKPYVEDDLMGTTVPLYYRRKTEADGGHGDEERIEEILDHKMVDGKLLFQVRWKDEDMDDSWEPTTTFIRDYNEVWLKYLQTKDLDGRLDALL